MIFFEKPESTFRDHGLAAVKDYFDQTATVVVMVVAVLCTDHLFSPLGTIVKQLAAVRPQAVQNPLALSFHVPAFFVPARSSGSPVPSRRAAKPLVSPPR